MAQRIRKDQFDLTAAERQAFTDAVWELKNTITYNGINPLRPRNIYDEFTEVHREAVAAAHRVPEFLPWHRKFMWDFETELLAAHERIQSCTANTPQPECTPSATFLTGIPYWDWTVDQGESQAPWTNDFMGGDGRENDFVVDTGPFGEASGWAVWDPTGVNGGPEIRRAFGSRMNGNGMFPNLPTAANVANALTISSYDVAPFNQTSAGASSFRNTLEGWAPTPSLHNLTHVWVDGTMFEGAISPSDPVFYLHHAYVDKVYSEWQEVYGTGPEAYAPASEVNDPLFQFPETTVADVLDISGPDLGYLYQARGEVVHIPRDLVVAVDVSDSMYGVAGFDGKTKLDAAVDAVNLLMTLLDPNAGHRVGLIEFRDESHVVHPLGETFQPFSLWTPDTTFDDLIRSRPTSLVEGLQGAQAMYPPKTPETNAPVMLVMSDGKHTAIPPYAPVALGDTTVHVVGYGVNANDALLSTLATDSGGTYYHADDALGTQKALAASFGELFKSGVSIDPFYSFAPGSGSTESLSFGITDERELTVVVGWESTGAIADIELVGPNGQVYLLSETEQFPEGTRATLSEVFAVLQVPLQALPDAGQGGWSVRAVRSEIDGQYPDHEEPYFVTTIVDGGALLRLDMPSVLYTGDSIVSVASLLDETMQPVDASLQVEMRRAGDPAHLVTQILADDGESQDGAAGDGLYAALTEEVATVPGIYSFLARAEYGNPTAPSVRERIWSANVEVGIDPAMTDLQVVHHPAEGDGSARQITVVITPQDRFGNLLGPGRADAFLLDIADNRAVDAMFSAVRDRLDGTYSFDVTWNAASGIPDFLLLQPGREGQRFFLPGSLRGAAGDQFVDLIVDSQTGELALNVDRAQVTEIAITAAEAIFDSDVIEALQLDGINLEVSPSHIVLRSNQPMEGTIHLGAGLLRGLNDFDFLADVSVEVYRLSQINKMSIIPEGRVSGDIVVVPEPDASLIALLLFGSGWCAIGRRDKRR